MDSQERRFELLLAEWETLQSRTQSDVTIWEERIERLVDEETKLRDAGLWVHGRADYLGVLARHRDELTHSRLIGWLLDPCARHGLGSRVLRGLLGCGGLTVDDAHALGRARVTLEHPLAGGRLDIVVDGPGFYLVIENKVDAAEGPDQCAFYAAHVDRADRVLIFLTPDGREATAAPDFIPVSYRALANLLADALSAATSSGAGRDVASEYLRTLRLEFL
jgi:hypothetical protein